MRQPHSEKGALRKVVRIKSGVKWGAGGQGERQEIRLLQFLARIVGAGFNIEVHQPIDCDTHHVTFRVYYLSQGILLAFTHKTETVMCYYFYGLEGEE
jgi:hypothetical protein